MNSIFEIEDEIVKKGHIGIQNNNGFTGLQIIYKNGIQKEKYYLRNNLIKERNAGMTNLIDQIELKRRFNTEQMNLFSMIEKIRHEKTFTEYEEGFKKATIYYDCDSEITDQQPENNVYYDGGDYYA